MRPAQEIIKRPLLTEKSTRLRETGGADDVWGEEEGGKLEELLGAGTVQEHSAAG